MEAILALMILPPARSLAVTFLTDAVAFLRAALALTSLALMAAFFAGGAADPSIGSGVADKVEQTDFFSAIKSGLSS